MFDWQICITLTLLLTLLSIKIHKSEILGLLFYGLGFMYFVQARASPLVPKALWLDFFI